MARIIFISLYDEFCHGIRLLVANLKKHKHTVNLICFKRYMQVPIAEVKELYDGMHIQVLPDGDYVNSYSEPPTQKEIDLLLERIREFQPDLIGMGLTYSQKVIASRLSKIIKEAFPGIPLVWGGPHPTTDPEWCLEYADFVCRGEADTAILEIAERISNNQPLYDVLNVWIKDDKGVLHKNIERPLVQDLDSLPFPDYDPQTTFFIDHNTISQGEPFEDSLLRTNFMVMTARGCPFSCSFCYTSYLKNMYGKQYVLRERSIPNVIEELKLAKKRRGNFYLEILDNVFTLKPKRLEEFAEAYHREIGLPYWCYTHPRCCRESTIAPLVKYDDFQYIIMGIQSASEHVGQKIFHRKHTAEEVLKATQVLNKFGVRAYYDIITNVPGETPEDCRANLDLLRKIPKPFRIRMTKISLFPNYEIRKETGEDKFVTNPMYRIWNALYFLVQDIDLTDEEVDSILADEHIRHHPEILEKINTAFGKYNTENYHLTSYNKLYKKMLCGKDKRIEELEARVRELEAELCDIKYRKGFRHFIRLSNFLRSVKRKLKPGQKNPS